MEQFKRRDSAEPATQRPAELVVHTGALTGSRFPIPAAPGELVLGRDASCDIQFDPERDRVVGRHHARLESATDGVYLEDLKSRNGTFVNGQSLGERRRLDDGVRFQLGQDGPIVEYSCVVSPVAHTVVVKPGRPRASAEDASSDIAKSPLPENVRGQTVFLSPGGDNAATRLLPGEGGAVQPGTPASVSAMEGDNRESLIPQRLSIAEPQRPAVDLPQEQGRRWSGADPALVRQVLIIGAILACAGLIGLGLAFAWPPATSTISP